ncbi:chemotaxis protein CheD [Motiliproteus sediminis]|uniref:chemotaxis protein CheD n=1 Tax=Motiliproteus sediminis TaxID=1468178 RepID=UPI001AEF9A30|nr:chemotaxis protein CheD [Motiliproteus sediminis]
MVVLKPGEFFFGTDNERIRTLLGSCIAITIWHPQRSIGGMCHYLLPASPRGAEPPYDGRYADHAMAMFRQALARTKTQAADYEVKLFGGANMFPHLPASGGDVGRRNIEAAHELLELNGFRVKDQHVGLTGHRTVILELATGHTWIKWQG